MIFLGGLNIWQPVFQIINPLLSVCVCSRACRSELCPAAGGRGLPAGWFWEDGLGEPPQGQRVHRECGPSSHLGQQRHRQPESPFGFAAVRQPRRTEGGVPAHARARGHLGWSGQCELHGFVFGSGQRYHLCCQQPGDQTGMLLFMLLINLNT